jgi:hypothetical protein
MSDMIWNGSYTLGDSQETQITAGTGIKVTTPAAGQIQISYDETSLFQAASSSGQLPADVTMSEAATNFEKLKILYKDRYTNSVGSLEIYTVSMAFDNTAQSQFSINCTFIASSIMYSRTSGFKFSNTTTISLQNTTQAQFKTDGTFTMGTGSGTTYPGPFIWKVVGINRIAGGN